MERMDTWVTGAMILLVWGIILPAWKIGLAEWRRGS